MSSAVVMRDRRFFPGGGVGAHGVSAGVPHGEVDTGGVQFGGGAFGSRPDGGGPGNVEVGVASPPSVFSSASATGAGPCGKDPAVQPDPSQ
ncbi:MAG: hypothetical protein ACRDZ8_14075 [Acidimicrobiales bacterium]